MPETGLCGDVMAEDGRQCNDGDACTQLDACAQGNCVGEVVVCEDDNPCTDNQCNINSGCAFPDNTDACDDDNPCTEGDRCDGGLCLPGENTCECIEDIDCADQDDEDPCNGTLHCVQNLCQVDPGTVVSCTGPDDCQQCPDQCSPCCGDEVRDDGEACDGSDFGATSCESLGYASGELACLDQCKTIDEGACVAPTLAVQNQVQLWAGILADFSQPILSPDGRFLAFYHSCHSQEGYCVLELLDLNTGDRVTLSDKADSFASRFSPDSRYFVYIHNYRSSWPSDGTFELWLKPLSGDPAFKIAEPVHNRLPFFTADGDYLVYGVGESSSVYDLYIASTCCGVATLIAGEVNYQSSSGLSPTSSYLTYYKNFNDNTHTADLWLASLPAGTSRLLSQTAHFTGSWGVTAFANNDQNLIYIDDYLRGGTGAIKAVTTTGGSATSLLGTVLTKPGLNNHDSFLRTLSPDNSYLIYWSDFDQVTERGTAYLRPSFGGGAFLLGSQVGFGSWNFSTSGSPPAVLYLDNYTVATDDTYASGLLKIYQPGWPAAKTVASDVNRYWARNTSFAHFWTQTDKQTGEATLHFLDLETGSSVLLGSKVVASGFVDNFGSFWSDKQELTETCTLTTYAIPSSQPRQEITRNGSCYHSYLFSDPDRLLYVENTFAGTAFGDLIFARMDGSDAQTIARDVVMGRVVTHDESGLALVHANLEEYPPVYARAKLLLLDPTSGALSEVEPVVKEGYSLWIAPNGLIQRMVYFIPEGAGMGIWRAEVSY